MTPPIATFETLDEAESALDWIGLDVADAERGFAGELSGDDRDLLVAAIEDPETPAPVRDLARLLLASWDEAGSATLEFAVAYAGA